MVGLLIRVLIRKLPNVPNNAVTFSVLFYQQPLFKNRAFLPKMVEKVDEGL